MRKLLNDSQQDILISRVYIAKAISIFNVKQLSKEWGMSRDTLMRYISENRRELSRKVAQQLRDRTERRDCTICFYCSKKTNNHARCPGCKILLHSNQRTCGSSYCIDYR